MSWVFFRIYHFQKFVLDLFFHKQAMAFFQIDWNFVLKEILFKNCQNFAFRPTLEVSSGKNESSSMTSAVNKAFVFAKKPTTINHDIQRLFLTTEKSEFTLFGEFLLEILNKNKTQSRAGGPKLISKTLSEPKSGHNVFVGQKITNIKLIFSMATYIDFSSWLFIKPLQTILKVLVGQNWPAGPTLAPVLRVFPV